MKYRKKPVVVEAMQFFENTFSDIVKFTNNKARCLSKKLSPSNPTNTAICIVDTLEGPVFATEGDYIIKGVNGEFYPCKPDIFEKTYEEADKEVNDKKVKYFEANIEDVIGYFYNYCNYCIYKGTPKCKNKRRCCRRGIKKFLKKEVKEDEN